MTLELSGSLAGRLGVCSWSLAPSNPVELVDRVSACGVPFVQLALNPLQAKPEVWGDVGQRLADAGIAARSGMFGCVGEDYSSLETIRRTGGLVPDATWEQNRQIVEAAAQSATRLGIDRVSSHAGFIPPATDTAAFGKLVERIRWVADRFSRDGLSLLLETGQETAEDLWTFLEAVDRTNVGVNFDPANMILYAKGDPVASLRRLMPCVRQVHIKDAVSTQTPGTWGREVAVGEGEVDWPAFLAALEEGDFAGDLVIEREAGASRVADVRQAKARLAAWAAEGVGR